MNKILHIDASGRMEESVTRKLSKAIVTELEKDNGKVIYRDVSAGLPYVNETMIHAYYTAKEARTHEQNQAIALSDEMVNELMQCDSIVIGIPMYNFGAPASLKAWADLVARVNETFRYTENGPEGLLKNKKAFVGIATGGVKIDSPVDYLTPWVRYFLGFLGIDDVEIIKAEALNKAGKEGIESALNDIQMRMR